MIEGATKLGIHLDSHQVSLFETYYRELIEWNCRINLTAIVEYEEVQRQHFLDSLTVLPLLPFGGIKLLDVGTGAGLPGLPIKIARPEIELTLLEATAKKTLFLNHVVSVIGLGGIRIVTGRAEEVARLAEFRESYDIVLSRALAKLPVTVELCLPFCRSGGLYIAYKKGDIKEEVEESLTALQILGGELREVRTVNIPELLEERCLVIIEKVAPTPEGYPRRPGIPQKRPLGKRR